MTKARRYWRVTIAVLFLALSALLLSHVSLHAQARHALIIANMGYAGNVGPLANPHKDAELVRQALIAAGYPDSNIDIVREAGRGAMLSAVERYATRLGQAGPDAVGFFYYSGHGAARPNTDRNYLIPVTVNDATSGALWHDAVALDDIRSLLQENAPQAAHIVVFDACRNQLQSGQRGVKGFVAVQEWGGMLIAYSTSPGKTASDGESTAAAGPYATALAEQLRAARGLSASELFESVRFKVRALTGGQSPWYLHGLDRPVKFGVPQAEEPSGPPRPTPPQPSAAVEAWQTIERTQSEAILEAFIARFGDTVYAGFARARLEELRLQKVDRLTSPGERIEELGLTLRATRDGVSIVEVVSSSEAAKKGLAKDSVILQAGGRSVSAPGDVRLVMQEAIGNGRKALLMQVRTGQQTRYVALQLGPEDAGRRVPRAQEESQSKPGKEDDSPGEKIEELGLTLRATPNGVTIVEVVSSSQAAEKGLKKDDVIVEAGGRSVSGPADVRLVMQEAIGKGRKALLMQVRSGQHTRYVALKLGPEEARPQEESQLRQGRDKDSSVAKEARPEEESKSRQGKEDNSPTARLLASYENWQVFVHGSLKTCFAATAPRDMKPKSVKRGTVFFYLTTWLVDGVSHEVSVKVGFTLKADSSPTLSIGSEVFELYAKDDKALMRDPADERKFLAAIRTGKSMTFKGVSSRGTEVVDTYSLAGVSQAVKRVEQDCQREVAARN